MGKNRQYQSVVITSSNDPINNELLVYDVNGNLKNKIATNGQGGISAGSNSGGIATNDEIIAVINNGSMSVSIFSAKEFKLTQTIMTQSPPISLAFGNKHLYILGTTTVESHRVRKSQNVVEVADGIANLLSGDGSAAQVGVIGQKVLVTEKTIITGGGLIELFNLIHGKITSDVLSVPLPASPGNLAPFGFVSLDNISYITIAHSNLVAVLQDQTLTSVISSIYQIAPCWITQYCNWLYTSNAGSHTLSKYNIIDNTIALDIPSLVQNLGAPFDIDTKDKVLSVLNQQNSNIFLNSYRISKNGTLKLISSINTNFSTTNGLILLPNYS